MRLKQTIRDAAVVALQELFGKAATAVIEFNKTHSFILLSTQGQLFVTGLSDFAGALPRLRIGFWDKHNRGVIHDIEFEDWKAVGDQVGVVLDSELDASILELDPVPEPETKPSDPVPPEATVKSEPCPSPKPEAGSE